MKENSPFFSGILQQDIEIRGIPARSPLFYRDVRLFFAIFSADLKSCQKILPDPRLEILSPLPGYALVGVNCFEYRHSDIGPYNEIAISVAVKPRKFRLPGLFAAMAAIIEEEYHAHIATLPVNTEIALYGGLDVFNFPKYRADIQFNETAGEVHCLLRAHPTGKLIYEFVADKIPTRSESKSGWLNSSLDTCTFYSYPMMKGNPVLAKVRIHRLEKGTSYLGSGFRVQSGTDEQSHLLENLKLDRLLSYQYIPRAEAILYAPQPL